MQVQSAKTFTYRRHEPETKLLYQVNSSYPQR